MYRASVSSELHTLGAVPLGAGVISKNRTDTASSPHGPDSLIRDVVNRLKCIQCCHRDDTSRMLWEHRGGTAKPGLGDQGRLLRENDVEAWKGSSPEVLFHE